MPSILGQENMCQIKNVYLLRSGHTHFRYSTTPFFLRVTMDQLVQDEPMLIRDGHELHSPCN